jgi:hypothetical protein
VPGEHLLLADGRAPPITAISHHDEITTVYNLSVANIHTFFVSRSGVLAHNTDCAPVPGPNGAIGDAKSAARRGGESDAAKFGRDVHVGFDKSMTELGKTDPRFTGSVTSGPIRPDARFQNVAIELKSNTPSGIRAGGTQLRKYGGGFLLTYDEVHRIPLLCASALALVDARMG